MIADGNMTYLKMFRLKAGIKTNMKQIINRYERGMKQIRNICITEGFLKNNYK
jgi:hypothetical protein